MSTIPTSATPWYKHKHVWLLVLLPLIAVVASCYTAYLAFASNDGLVSSDYYREGQAINQRLDMQNSTRSRGIKAQLMLGSDRQSVRVVLNQPVSSQLILSILHPTRAGQDQILPLQGQTSTLFVGKLPSPLNQARWEVQLADQPKTWQLGAEWKVSEGDAVDLLP